MFLYQLTLTSIRISNRHQITGWLPIYWVQLHATQKEVKIPKGATKGTQMNTEFSAQEAHS